jgi:hypothetical protein
MLLKVTLTFPDIEKRQPNGVTPIEDVKKIIEEDEDFLSWLCEQKFTVEAEYD